MNKFTKQEISIEQYLAALRAYREESKYIFVPENDIRLTDSLVNLITRYSNDCNNNAEKLEIVKDFCDEYLYMTPTVNKKHYLFNFDTEWYITSFRGVPNDLRENIKTAAREPSKRESRIRKNIGKLLDR